MSWQFIWSRRTPDYWGTFSGRTERHYHLRRVTDDNGQQVWEVEHFDAYPARYPRVTEYGATRYTGGIIGGRYAKLAEAKAEVQRIDDSYDEKVWK